MTDETQAPGLIPDQLLSKIQEGDCVLFLEADLSLGYEGAPLSWADVAAVKTFIEDELGGRGAGLI